jgi:hypothetical protein
LGHRLRREAARIVKVAGETALVLSRLAVVIRGVGDVRG